LESKEGGGGQGVRQQGNRSCRQVERKVIFYLGRNGEFTNQPGRERATMQKKMRTERIILHRKRKRELGPSSKKRKNKERSPTIPAATKTQVHAQCTSGCVLFERARNRRK